jgi:hypothetical protein
VQTIEGASVNIYFNDDKIESNISGTTYFHSNPTGDKQCYRVEVNCLEGGVSPLSEEFCANVGINENEQMATFILYPNPAKGELRIRSRQVNEIEIFDVFGRKQKAEDRRQKGDVVVNISNLSAGVYFIRIIGEQGFAVQRFIKE